MFVVAPAAAIASFLAVVVALAATVPLVIVFELPARTLPVPFVELTAIVTGSDPGGTGIRQPGPIAIVPFVMPAGRIPITIYPIETRTRGDWPNADDAWRRRRSDRDSDGDLTVKCAAGQEHEREQFLFHTGLNSTLSTKIQMSANQ